ncbi:MAG: putative exported protein [Myxococcales bacterium]|nr:putative exported protein [Myxococcales bacterium]
MLIACTAVAVPAHADHSSLHATANGSVATTDNVFGSDGNRQADIFFDLRPGVLFAYDAPRMIHELNAEADILEYVAHSESASVTGRGGWKGFFLPGPRSEVTLTANGGTGQLNALTSGTAPNMTGVGLTPGGRIYMKEADAGEYVSWTATKETRISQAALARWTNTDDAASQPAGQNTSVTSAEAGGGLGFERSFEHNSIGINAGISYLYMRRIAPVGGPTMGPRLDHQLNPRGTLAWRHDIDKRWSGGVDGGVVYVHPVGFDPDHPMAVHRSAPFFIIGGLLAYTDVWGRATLDVRRAVTPNQFIAQNTLSEGVTAQVAMPLPWLDDNPHMRAPKLVGLGSVGYEHSELIDSENSSVAGAFDIGRLDAGVGYSPTPGKTFGLRYEFVYQRANTQATAAFPSTQASYFRNTLYFTFSFRYPERVAVRVPRRAGQSVRADRKDLSPVGAEPVVPDPTEQLPDDGGGGE